MASGRRGSRPTATTHRRITGVTRRLGRKWADARRMTLRADRRLRSGRLGSCRLHARRVATASSAAPSHPGRVQATTATGPGRCRSSTAVPSDGIAALRLGSARSRVRTSCAGYGQSHVLPPGRAGLRRGLRAGGAGLPPAVLLDRCPAPLAVWLYSLRESPPRFTIGSQDSGERSSARPDPTHVRDGAGGVSCRVGARPVGSSGLMLCVEEVPIIDA
jgi:hypothetical protein